MNNIPKKLNEQMNQDSYYKFCCLADENCEGKIERHHALIFGGKQVQKKYCILPACEKFHHRYANRKDIKEKMDWIWLNRATEEELKEVSKAIDYKKVKERLNKIYENI